MFSYTTSYFGLISLLWSCVVFFPWQIIIMSFFLAIATTRITCVVLVVPASFFLQSKEKKKAVSVISFSSKKFQLHTSFVSYDCATKRNTNYNQAYTQSICQFKTFWTRVNIFQYQMFLTMAKSQILNKKLSYLTCSKMFDYIQNLLNVVNHF